MSALSKSISVLILIIAISSFPKATPTATIINIIISNLFTITSIFLFLYVEYLQHHRLSVEIIPHYHLIVFNDQTYAMHIDLVCCYGSFNALRYIYMT